MAIQVRPTEYALGAEITGVDLTAPLADADLAAIRGAIRERIVIAVRGQERMTPDHLLAFTRLFGEPDKFHLARFTYPGLPNVMVISNIKVNGQPIGATGGGVWWHTDQQYHPRPAAYTMLLGKETPPEGADTIFANMYLAYEGLPDETKRRIDGMTVNVTRVKTYAEFYPHRPPLSEEEKAKLPDITQPLVRIHPESGRRALYCGGAEASWDIVGMGHEEGRALLADLRAFAIRPQFAYPHKWQPGDLVMWDNRCALHSATPYDTERYRRLLYRTTVTGELPIRVH